MIIQLTEREANLIKFHVERLMNRPGQPETLGNDVIVELQVALAKLGLDYNL
jgi:hypothetical protein